MRLATVAVTATLFVAAASVVRPARADVAYSYEIENGDAYRDRVLVVWPRTCGASGDPLGTIDLALNPDWGARMNDVDYEVVLPGTHHQLLAFCNHTSRLYALPAEAFSRAEREATADDMAIGQTEAGAVFAILPALDAIDLKKRVEFFARDPRVLRTTFRFQVEKPPRAGNSPVKAVHDVLAVEAFDGTSFAVVEKRAIYTYTDGRTELVPHGVSGDASSGEGASAPPGAGGDASASATAGPSAGADAGVGAGSAPSAADKGTRWVYLAAVAGLLAGGIMAFYRKKKAVPPGA